MVTVLLRPKRAVSADGSAWLNISDVFLCLPRICRRPHSELPGTLVRFDMRFDSFHSQAPGLDRPKPARHWPNILDESVYVRSLSLWPSVCAFAVECNLGKHAHERTGSSYDGTQRYFWYVNQTEISKCHSYLRTILQQYIACFKIFWLISQYDVSRVHRPVRSRLACAVPHR